MQRNDIYSLDIIPDRDSNASGMVVRRGSFIKAFRILKDTQAELDARLEDSDISILITRSKGGEIEYSVLKKSDKNPDNIILKINPSEELEEVIEEISVDIANLIPLDIEFTVDRLTEIIQNDPKNQLNFENGAEDKSYRELITEIVKSSIKSEYVDLVRKIYVEFKQLNENPDNVEENQFEELLLRLNQIIGEIKDPNFTTGVESIDKYLIKYFNKLFLALNAHKKFLEKLGEYYKTKISEGDFSLSESIIGDFNIDLNIESAEIQKLIEDSILNTAVEDVDIDLLISRIQRLNIYSPELRMYIKNLVEDLKNNNEYSSLLKIYFGDSGGNLLNESVFNSEILVEILKFNIRNLSSSEINNIIEKVKSLNPDFEFESLNLDSEILENIKNSLSNSYFMDALGFKNLLSKKDLPQDIKNLSTEIFRRLMREDTGIVLQRFLYENGFLTNEELTEYEMQALTGNYPPETLISNVYAYDISYSEKINDISELPRFIEAPLLEAVTTLWSKGIKTLGSTANKKDVGHFASLDIDLKSLSDENKKILDSLITTNKFLLEINDVRESFSLKIKILEDSTILDISKIAKEFVSYFKKQ